MNNNYGKITDKNDSNFGRTKTSVWSRSMGFYRPISFFNIGKRAEFEERKTFKENIIFDNIRKLLKKEPKMPCGKKKGGKK
jgi:hypothetical protein